MKRIFHFGTFDINSYEDLLFPLIAKHKLKDLNDYTLKTVSPVGGALVEFSDAKRSEGIFDVLDEVDAVDGALIGGGNIIRTLPAQNETYVAAHREYLAYSDLWIGPTFVFPKRIPIVWNAPRVFQGFSKVQHALIKAALMRTDYISVCDEESQHYLLDVWPDANITVVPDSIRGVSKLWSQAELRLAYEAVFKRLQIPLPKRSIIFPIHYRDLGQGKMSIFARQLDRIAKQVDAQPILIPFKFSPKNFFVIGEISALMSSCPIILHNVQSLQEITACIAHAQGYVGTSMRGLMIASAFEVPGVAIATHSMAKVAGFSPAQLQEIIVQDWDQALDVLKNMDVEQNKAQLRVSEANISRALDEHWDHIHRTFQKTHVSSESNAFEARTAWRKSIDYQNKAIASIFEAHKEEQHQIKIREISVLRHQKDAWVKRAQRVENSLSWKVSKPLRLVFKKFPIAKKVLLKIIKWMRLFYRKLFRRANASSVSVEWKVPKNIIQQIAAYQDSSSTKKKIVLYTAIFGDCDTLVVPKWIDKHIDYVCFTDRPQNDYGLWQIRPSPYYHTDPVRIARYIKTHPHQLFPYHEIAIWTDANVVLCGDVQRYIKILNDEQVHLGLIPHPLRDCFYQEAAACKLHQKDNPAIIDAQANFYKENGLKEQEGLFETNFMIIRLADSKVAAMFHLWWQHIQRFSRRDQLALAWAWHHCPVPVINLLPKGISVREHIDFEYYAHQQSRQFALPASLVKLGHLTDPYIGIPFINVKEERLANVKDQPIDIIVCVHNALEDVRLCLESVRQYLLSAHRIIIVNDDSDQPTTKYLRKFSANDEQVILVENETNLGYVQSANRALTIATAGFCIVLNSDTIVHENWAVKMLDVASQNPEIGIVSPLSNAAGVQSLPEIKSGKNNTAINVIPEGISISDIDYFLETISLAHTVPHVLLAHGFCFGIKREVIDSIGLFDEENFVRYYGEENDYCLRAAAAGFCSAIATNTFVYHRKSRSISEKERIIHMEESGRKLRELYGVNLIRAACLQGQHHPLLERIRSHVRVFYEDLSRSR